MLVNDDSKIEKFNQLVENFLRKSELNSIEAKILWKCMKYNTSKSLKIETLNTRYTFCTHPKYKYVPESVESFLEFLDSLDYIHHGYLCRALEVYWNNN